MTEDETTKLCSRDRLKRHIGDFSINPRTGELFATCDACRESTRKYFNKLSESGCCFCGEPVAEGRSKWWCVKHLDAKRTHRIEWQRERAKNGICECGRIISNASNFHCDVCLEKDKVKKREAREFRKRHGICICGVYITEINPKTRHLYHMCGSCREKVSEKPTAKRHHRLGVYLNYGPNVGRFMLGKSINIDSRLKQYRSGFNRWDKNTFEVAYLPIDNSYERDTSELKLMVLTLHSNSNGHAWSEERNDTPKFREDIKRFFRKGVWTIEGKKLFDSEIEIYSDKHISLGDFIKEV